MTMTQDHIVPDPAVLAGKPVIRGTRLSVEFIIGLMADGWSEADILANYPALSRADIAACRLPMPAPAELVRASPALWAAGRIGRGTSRLLNRMASSSDRCPNSAIDLFEE
jgi:uncharacterized protein (DUF433 family)